MPEVSSGLRLTRTADVREFDRISGDFLCAREAEHNLILGLCANVRAAKTNPYGALPPYFAVVHAADEVVGAAMRTPPYNLILSGMSDERAADVILQDVLDKAPDIPGVLGEKEVARRFAQGWTERTGRAHRIKMAERIFRLTRVVPPWPASGRLRVAGPRDIDVLADWFSAFSVEALREDGTRGRATAEWWLGTAGRVLYVWEDGDAVSMCGASGRTPNGIRIGAVYTPPELRGRGYASNCVATASQAQLDAGLRFCFLFTDLANPTSNHIYRQMGYEAVCDVDEYRFEESLP